jgi:hypothetical protein
MRLIQPSLPSFFGLTCRYLLNFLVVFLLFHPSDDALGSKQPVCSDSALQVLIKQPKWARNCQGTAGELDSYLLTYQAELKQWAKSGLFAHSAETIAACAILGAAGTLTSEHHEDLSLLSWRWQGHDDWRVVSVVDSCQAGTASYTYHSWLLRHHVDQPKRILTNETTEREYQPLLVTHEGAKLAIKTWKGRDSQLKPAIKVLSLTDTH